MRARDGLTARPFLWPIALYYKAVGNRKLRADRTDTGRYCKVDYEGEWPLNCCLHVKGQSLASKLP
jgi:hypothetical protein